jgi:hypothetical protein
LEIVYNALMRFSLKDLLLLVALFAIEVFFLTLIIGPRYRVFVRSDWSVPITTIWLAYGFYLGSVLTAFVKREDFGWWGVGGGVIGMIMHFVIAFSGIIASMGK